MESKKKTKRYDTSGSDSEPEEAVNFKRTRRSSSSTESSGRQIITFSNGAQNGNNSQVRNRPVAVVDGLRGSADVVDSRRINLAIRDVPNRLDDPSPARIMAQMGFENGRGLARFIQPMAPANVAFSIEEFEDKIRELGIDDSDIDSDSDDVVVEEEVSWIPPKVSTPIEFSVLHSWRRIGTMLTSIEDQTYFIAPRVLKELTTCKKLYMDMDSEQYQSVRARANTFERIGKGPFICRAAMKMANLDSVLGFSLTEPKSQSGNPVVGHNDLFYFADVCAGPGGFTEYVLWKKKWEAKGFGLTLKGELDFNTANFVAAEVESFEAYYGPANDGNIYKPENVLGYVNYVLACTDGKGVHLMMADGGFSVTKQENIQEVLSGQIILSQCAVALGVVRTGGHFVCKLFDVCTPLTVGLIYLMYLSFDLVSIHKPNTSRPANSERYLICKWKREGTENVQKYINDCHRLLWEFRDKTVNSLPISILEIVPIALLTQENPQFFDYIFASNNTAGEKQIMSLKKMIRYIRDPMLKNEGQGMAVMKSLELWGVPTEIPDPRKLKSTEKMYTEILGSYPLTLAKNPEKSMSPAILETTFKSPYDWRFVVVAASICSQNRGFYLSTGRDMVYRHDGFSWILKTFVGEKKMELPTRTLLYGEVVDEVHGKRPTQKLVTAFHIIDALMLGGKDIRSLHYTQRHEFCVKFAKAMNRNVENLLPIRVKNPVRMENIADVIDRLDHRVIKYSGDGAKLVCPTDHTDETCPVVQPAGLLFIKITKDPWQMALNRQANRKFWFNKLTGKASNSVPEDAIANFYWTMHNRVTWWWDKETNVILSSLEPGDPRLHQMNVNKVHAYSLTNHIDKALRTAPQKTVTSPGNQSAA